MEVVVGRKWHDPVDNPMLCLYSQNGKAKKPWHGSFGKKIRDGVSTHTGMDLFAIPGSNVYACVKGKVVRSEINSSLFGQLIVVKVLDKVTFKSKRKKNFKLKFAHKGELESQGFNYDGDFYLLYAHLKERKVKIGKVVEAVDLIGLSGTSGYNGDPFTTCNPHVHFEIINVSKKKGLNQKCNPGVYLDYKNEEDLTKEDIALQEKARTDKTLQKQ
jgi:murein DD-endopeptidase MepM/ murein hydrolase activator NlpD